MAIYPAVTYTYLYIIALSSELSLHVCIAILSIEADLVSFIPRVMSYRSYASSPRCPTENETVKLTIGLADSFAATCVRIDFMKPSKELSW